MVTLCFKKRSGLAQIPVLLGLLIMALVVPAATKLVQENQDSRNQAAGCTLEGDMVTRTGSCCSGLIKTECTVSYCLCTKPVATSTPRPVATSTPRPSSYTCSSLGGSCVSYGCTCGTITGGTCQGEDECCRPCPTSTPKPTATLTPTKRPTSTPTRAPSPTPTTACSGTCQYSDCLTMNMKTGVGFCPPPQYCCGEKIIAPKCNLGDKYCATDNSGVWVCKTDRSGYTLINCSSGKKCDSVTEKCVSISTPTPTKRPTSTPTRVPTATPTTACTGTCQYSDCLIMNMKTGVGACPRPQYCCGEKILSYACNIGERTCLSDKSGVNICKPDRTGYTVFKCSEGRVCDPNTKTCVSLSSTLTPTPTNVEKVVCSSKVIGRCGPEGGCAYGYRCLSGAGTFNCSYDPACGAFTATATPKPTATANPVSSCIQENQTYQEGKCCPGLVRVKTPYGSICGKTGTCTPGSTKCDDSNKFVLVCDASGYFQKNQSCGGECKNGKCEIICTTGQTRCRDNKTLEVCNESGTSFTSQSCDYKCEYNKCVEKPMADVTPTPIDCLPGKKTCTGNKGMMECNSKGDGYNYFQCGILCVGGRCFGETITVGEPINPTNCISGEIKCEATSNGGFSEFKCNSSGFWDEILSCASGCYYGRCKQTTETEGCLKENERYEEGKCCPGLVKVTSPYGYYCGKPGTCTPGTTKCENNSIWKCDTSGYFSKIKSCDFGCGGNECNFGCFPKSTKCRNEQTLQVCSDDGTAWLSRSCNYCSEGICFSSKKEAEENLAYSDTGWDGEGPLPYCYAPSAEEIGLNTCPEGYICGAQKVEDRNGLYYCEKKTVENSIVKACVANSSFCGQGGVLLRCSSDGMRWAAAWQCPAPRPEKGSQYNYSCRQVSTDRGECRPPTPEEGRDVAVEIVGLTAATVASVLALPAVITNPAIASTAFRVVRIGNAAYAINNAANECQSFESMTNDEKLKCALAAGYAVTSMVDAGLAGTGLINPTGSAFLSGVEVTNDVANLALGGVNAYNQCENGTDRDCYAALISAGIDLIALGVDVNQSKQWSQANLKIEAETLLDTSTVTDSGVFIPTLKTQIGTLTDTSVTNLTPGRPIVNMSQITGNKIVGTLTDTSMTNLTPGRPIVNVSQITGSKIGGGSFGSTYLDKNSNVLTKIFFDPDLPENASQISFYQQYGNAPLVQGYMGDVVDESGKVIGFQQAYIPNTVPFNKYVNNGGSFTQESVDEVVNNLVLNQSITGQAHGDLVRPDNILNFQGDRGWPGYIHPGNVLVEILPDGSPKIHIIDWNGYNTFTEALSSPDVMQLELDTFRNGLQQFVP